jgi:hypothetical protein
LDGIRSRPLASDGLFGPVDGYPIDPLAPGQGLPPAMPIDAPSGWFHRNDGIDFPDDPAATLWAYGGQPMASPLAPGDGLEFPLPLVDDLDGIDFAPVSDSIFDSLSLDGTDAAFTGAGLVAAADGVDGFEGLSPLGPVWLAGGAVDDVDFSGEEGLAGGTFFPAMYRADALDGADPAPEDALPPLPAPDLDGITWPELETAGAPLADDAVFFPEFDSDVFQPIL